MTTLKQRIDERFGVSSLGSTLGREVLAGVTTYLSLAYIFIVNPAILSSAGMNVSAVFFATVVASSLSTLIMGFYARQPFALAPGLEMNGFFSVTVVSVMGFTWNEALGAVFWSGLLCILFTVLPVRQRIIDSIPDGLKKAMAVSVGVFVLTIGLFLSGLVSFEGGKVAGVNFSITPKSTVLVIGFAVAAVLGLRRLRIPGGMLIAIIVATVYCKTRGITVVNPAQLNSDLFLAVLELDLIPSNVIEFIPVILVFFLLDFYGSIGKFIGLTASTNIMVGGKLPRMEKAMGVDAVGTVAGSLLGTSSIITYVESSIGIATGGRTGIVAIVCGALMLVSLAFTPVVGLVPVEATAGILVYVGYLLMRDTWEEKGITAFDISVALAMGIVSFFTFSLDKTMLLGFALYTARQLFAGQRNLVLVVSTALLAVAVLLPLALQK